MLDLGAKPFDVVVENRTRKYIRGEVAVAALGPAKRDGNVQSERHQYDYAVFRLQASGQSAPILKPEA